MILDEYPIPFASPMIRARRAGIKTQTRRIMAVQPPEDARVECGFYHPTVVAKNGDEEPGPEVYGAWWDDGARALRYPYGKPGGRLWFREAWRTVAEADHLPPRELDAAYRFWYEADAPHQPGYGKLRPGMFMPRFAAREFATVAWVRVERLQDISAADCISEGIGFEVRYGGHCLPDGSHFHATDPRESYWSLWESINGPGSVEANPWVWVTGLGPIAA